MKGLSSRACRISRGHFKSCTCNASDSRVSRNSRPAAHHAAPDGTGGFGAKGKGSLAGPLLVAHPDTEAPPAGATPYPPTVSTAVLSAMRGLTAEFGMGSGGTPSPWSRPRGAVPSRNPIPLSSAPWGPHGAPSRGLRKIRSVSRSSVIR